MKFSSTPKTVAYLLSPLKRRTMCRGSSRKGHRPVLLLFSFNKIFFFYPQQRPYNRQISMVFWIRSSQWQFYSSSCGWCFGFPQILCYWTSRRENPVFPMMISGHLIFRQSSHRGKGHPPILSNCATLFFLHFLRRRGVGFHCPELTRQVNAWPRRLPVCVPGLIEFLNVVLCSEECGRRLNLYMIEQVLVAQVTVWPVDLTPTPTPLLSFGRS